MGPDGLPLSERLTRLLDGLGIGAAHFCVQTPEDLVGLVNASPDRVASVVMVGANGLPSDFAAIDPRVLWIMGDRGPIGTTMRPRVAELPDRQIKWLEGYEQFMWSDTASDRLDETAHAILEFLAGVERARSGVAPLPSVGPLGQGEIGEVPFRAESQGTPLILLPLGLSSQQWEPMLAKLQAHHCTVVLGGRHLNPVLNLESRAASGYAAMALGHLRLVEPQSDERFIEVGCGSGALLRRIVVDRGSGRAGHPVVGLDINRFLLTQAEALAKQAGVMDRLELREGSAEAIPYPDATFDVVFSSTVMEEVDAERMLAELVRIAKPGGSVAVIVRSVDRGQWTNAPVSPAVRHKIEASAGVGGVTGTGCADESLYVRFQRAGLENIRGGAAWVSVSPSQPWWANVERQVRTGLDPEGAAEWRQVIASARANATPIWVARAFHCAIGTKL